MKKILILFGLILSISIDAQIINFFQKKLGSNVHTINIVFDGDSHTNLNIYPPLLVQELRDLEYVVSYSTIGVGGRTSTQMLANVQNVIDGHDSQVDLNLCIYWIGTNDIYYDVSNATTDSNLKAYYNAIKSQFTVMQIGTTDLIDDPTNKSQTLNQMFIDNWEGNYSDNFLNLLSDSRYQDYSNTDIFYDGVHMTTLGYTGVSDLSLPLLLQLIN